MSEKVQVENTQSRALIFPVGTKGRRRSGVTVIPGKNWLTVDEWAAILSLKSGKTFVEKGWLTGPAIEPKPAAPIPKTKEEIAEAKKAAAEKAAAEKAAAEKAAAEKAAAEKAAAEKKPAAGNGKSGKGEDIFQG